MEECSTVVGMDVHGDTIDVAIAEDGGAREVRHYGRIASDLPAVDRLIGQLGQAHRSLRFVYFLQGLQHGLLVPRASRCVASVCRTDLRSDTSRIERRALRHGSRPGGSTGLPSAVGVCEEISA